MVFGIILMVELVRLDQQELVVGQVQQEQVERQVLGYFVEQVMMVQYRLGMDPMERAVAVAVAVELVVVLVEVVVLGMTIVEVVVEETTIVVLQELGRRLLVVVLVHKSMLEHVVVELELVVVRLVLVEVRAVELLVVVEVLEWGVISKLLQR